jgi:hypothetical protein
MTTYLDIYGISGRWSGDIRMATQYKLSSLQLLLGAN